MNLSFFLSRFQKKTKGHEMERRLNCLPVIFVIPPQNVKSSNCEKGYGMECVVVSFYSHFLKLHSIVKLFLTKDKRQLKKTEDYKTL